MTMTAEQIGVNAVEGTVRMYFNGIDHRKELQIPGGPWDNEPSKMQWVDKDTNLPCLIIRGGGGALCGYAGVFPEHRLHGKDYDSAGGQIDVHGGLTFASGCGHGEDESRGVCHVPEPGTTDSVWWFGFDCAHLYDLTPLDTAKMLGLAQYKSEWKYRDVRYVAAEVASLAAQLRAIEKAADA
jgi:hypothetical protein